MFCVSVAQGALPDRPRLSDAHVANQIHISEATVKSHIGHIFTKLDLSDRADAVVLAFDNRVVEPRV
jgi:DNA-binding NarL/FixJ family response regulator